MTRKTTTRKSWVYVDKWYGPGRFSALNYGDGSMQVQFRSVINNYTRRVEPRGCTDMEALPYTEVFFKSIKGDSVTIETRSKSCTYPLVDELSEAICEDEVDFDTKVKYIQMAEDMRNGEYEPEEA
jgi:hypothetical protein